MSATLRSSSATKHELTSQSHSIRILSYEKQKDYKTRFYYLEKKKNQYKEFFEKFK